jgi:serine/threonine protein kinase
MLSRNTILQNRYRIVRPLGKGGMGEVYEAIDDTVDSIVAIKETFANTDKLRSAFEHEAKLLANLKHPVLPRVMHHFLQGNRQFLVMEFVDGLNLAQLLELRGLPFRYETIIPWTEKLLDALAYLHRQREPIIHRDIKPANIKATNEGEIYLLDFGLAKGAPGQDTSSVHGYTAAYAPLEQLNNSGTSAQSDLYSLGATLYHLLTGDPPISASKREEIMEDGNRDPLIPVHRSNPELPEALSVIIAQAMGMKRRDRFASAVSMRESLREATLLIQRERERKILDTPTRLTDEASRSKEHGFVLRETEAVADLGDQRMVNPVVPWKDRGREDVYQKTMGQVVPPVVPPPPPSDPAQPSWPSRIDSESGTSPDLEKQREEEEEKLREAAEAEARQAAIESERARKEAGRFKEKERKAKEAEAEARRQVLAQFNEAEPSAALRVPARTWNKKRVAVIVLAALFVTNGILVVGLLAWRRDGASDSVNQKQVNQQTINRQDTPPAPSNHKLTKNELNNIEQALSSGNDQRDAKHYAQAESEYRRALLINPGEARAYNGLGNVFYDQGRYEDAITQFRKAVEIDRNNAESHYSLGLSYLNSNNKTAAMEQYEALKNLKSDYAGQLLSEINKH